jgi:hypothetical protein
MKRFSLAFASISLLAAASCGTDATVNPSGSGGMNGSGGASSGGATGSGGSTTGSGGANSGGTTGSGGASSGGTTGSGGTTTMTGGMTGSSGGATGSGGAGTGSGGATPGTGGQSQGGNGAVGAGGRESGSGGMGAGGRGPAGGASGTGGGAGGSPNLMAVAVAWDGQLVTYPCGTSGSGYDCANVGCVGNMATKMNSWTMAGTASTVYSVTFNVRGIVEAYSYVGGTRDGGSVTNNLDLFQRGGMAQASGGSNYDYNTYELDVSPAVTGESNVYFLNSVTSAEGPHASNSPTQHLTFPINYTKTIKVMGNSVVTLKVFDSNCTLVQNCGPTMGNTCTAPRTVSLTGVTPAAPTSFMQPFQMPTGKYGQWVYFDVTNVTAN